MGWKLITKDEYISIFSEVLTVFHTVDFNNINSSKAESIYYLYYSINDCNYGIILGKSLNNFNSPFSAPFGGLIYSGIVSRKDLKKVGADLISWISIKKGNLYLTLPPLFYDVPFLNMLIEEWKNLGFKTNYVDLNSHYSLKNQLSFDQLLNSKARNKFKNSLKNQFKFDLVVTENEKIIAYSIIQQNRKERGFPLKMSFDDLEKTSKIVQIDYFILEMNLQQSAAAIVFNISETVAYVVYWGNIESSSIMRPMNLLPKLLFDYYKSIGKEFLDIGTSSEMGIINEGLTSYKKSIGCITNEKYSLKFIYA